MNSRATFESSHAGRIGAYAAGADGMSRSKSASAPAAVILDPRAKLYLLLLANMLLFFHADARAEALLTALFLTPLFLAGRWRMGLRLTACYAVLLGLGLLSDAATLDTAGASGAASASGSGADAWIHVVGLFSVGLRMMMPCFITGATRSPPRASANSCARCVVCACPNRWPSPAWWSSGSFRRSGGTTGEPATRWPFAVLPPADSRCCGIRPSRWSSCWFRC